MSWSCDFEPTYSFVLTTNMNFYVNLWILTMITVLCWLQLKFKMGDRIQGVSERHSVAITDLKIHTLIPICVYFGICVIVNGIDLIPGIMLSQKSQLFVIFDIHNHYITFAFVTFLLVVLGPWTVLSFFESDLEKSVSNVTHYLKIGQEKQRTKFLDEIEHLQHKTHPDPRYDGDVAYFLKHRMGLRLPNLTQV